MKSTLLVSVATAVWLLGLGTGMADLCQKCREGIYITSIGACVQCKGATTSAAFKLCRPCSAKLDECERCRTRLNKVKTPGTEKR